jgi:hypothetical protein
MMSLFVRITAIVAVAAVTLILLAFLVKIVFFAALVAALVIGGLALYNLFRRRGPAPVVRYTAPRYTARR